MASFDEVKFDSYRVDAARKKGVKVVAEEWLLKCIEEKKRIDEGPYILVESEVDTKRRP